MLARQPNMRLKLSAPWPWMSVVSLSDDAVEFRL